MLSIGEAAIMRSQIERGGHSIDVRMLKNFVQGRLGSMMLATCRRINIRKNGSLMPYFSSFLERFPRNSKWLRTLLLGT
jgi:hypothetical protein